MKGGIETRPDGGKYADIPVSRLPPPQEGTVAEFAQKVADGVIVLPPNEHVYQMVDGALKEIVPTKIAQ